MLQVFFATEYFLKFSKKNLHRQRIFQKSKIIFKIVVDATKFKNNFKKIFCKKMQQSCENFIWFEILLAQVSFFPKKLRNILKYLS